MEKALKPIDEQEIKRHLDHHPHASMLREFLSWKHFSVGDVLIQIDRDHDNRVTQVSEVCKVPRKFKVLYIDELGVPWVKHVSVRGGLGRKIRPLTDMMPTRYTFEIDPEKFEAEMFGYRYDPRIEYKRMRDVNPDYGKE